MSATLSTTSKKDAYVRSVSTTKPTQNVAESVVVPAPNPELVHYDGHFDRLARVLPFTNVWLRPQGSFDFGLRAWATSTADALPWKESSAG